MEMRTVPAIDGQELFPPPGVDSPSTQRTRGFLTSMYFSETMQCSIVRTARLWLVSSCLGKSGTNTLSTFKAELFVDLS